ncbi:MAG: zinc metalloprotease HtpX [Hyphomicrobium sp.]
MTIEAENSPSRPLQRGASLAIIAQAGVLLAGFAALLALILWPEFGNGAAIIALLAAAGIVVIATRVAPWTIMRIYGARPYEAGDLAQFDRITSELARRAGLRRAPRLFVVPSMLLSAFSVGSSQRFGIAVTEGLLRRLTMREVAAVLAREVAHAQRGDLFVLGIADVVSRCAQGLYYVGLALAALNVLRSITGAETVPWLSVLLLILAPILMTSLQLTLSRSREIEADRAAALLTGDPLGVASAISRLDSSPGSPLDDLMPPVPARKVPLPSMLRFPPPAERRIPRLNTFQAPPMPPLDTAEGPRISLIGVGPIEMRPRYRWPGVWF